MAYHSNYSGAEVDALLDKIKNDDVGSIDSSLSTTSENPVQNKVITEELNKKANKTDIATINGQTLTNGGNIEVVTDAYDDTEIKGKLTELDSQIAAEATARTEADAALQKKINGKQDALTLTVKDNGNIVLANIQGQSKEFMPATPSGDPMHYAYVAAGAEYNDTGSDIVKTTPWADMIDDDYTGDYGKTVVHKAGYWYLNGLGDITNEEMKKIFVRGNVNFTVGNTLSVWKGDKNIYIRTNLNYNGGSQETIAGSRLTQGNTALQIALFTNNMREGIATATLFKASQFHNIYQYHILGVFYSYPLVDFSNSTHLISLKLTALDGSAIFKDASNLSMKSVLYMINHEAATSAITITLHADVYNRCMANADILAALQAHTNVSLASA